MTLKEQEAKGIKFTDVEKKAISHLKELGFDEPISYLDYIIDNVKSAAKFGYNVEEIDNYLCEYLKFDNEVKDYICSGIKISLF